MPFSWSSTVVLYYAIFVSNLGGGQSDHIAPALLHTLEEFPLKTLDLNTLFGSSVRLPEEACTQVCHL